MASEARQELDQLGAEIDHAIRDVVAAAMQMERDDGASVMNYFEGARDRLRDQCRRHVEEYRTAVLEREAMRQERDALRAKLAAAVSALEVVRPHFQSYEECDEEGCAPGWSHKIRESIDTALRAAKEADHG